MLDQDLSEVKSEEREANHTYLTFNLGAQYFAVNVSQVREILGAKDIFPLPNASMAVLGIIDIRGTSMPIFDLRPRLGIPQERISDESRIIVFDFESCSNAVGILADQVRRVEIIPKNRIEALPVESQQSTGTPDFEGLFKRDGEFIFLMNVERSLIEERF